VGNGKCKSRSLRDDNKGAGNGKGYYNKGHGYSDSDNSNGGNDNVNSDGDRMGSGIFAEDAEDFALDADVCGWGVDGSHLVV
jgi:hypothetical protein